jgi:hypothetical protein
VCTRGPIPQAIRRSHVAQTDSDKAMRDDPGCGAVTIGVLFFYKLIGRPGSAASPPAGPPWGWSSDHHEVVLTPLACARVVFEEMPGAGAAIHAVVGANTWHGGLREAESSAELLCDMCPHSVKPVDLRTRSMLAAVSRLR